MFINSDEFFFVWYYVKQCLLPAIDEFLIGVDKGFCVRHLYNNFRKKFMEKNLKNWCGELQSNIHICLGKGNEGDQDYYKWGSVLLFDPNPT